jgi:alkylated DNA nucleotide flippase Atl1
MDQADHVEAAAFCAGCDAGAVITYKDPVSLTGLEGVARTTGRRQK